MKLKSLGYKSELVFTDFDGQVDDRGSYVVLRTLTNPNYFWGNLLIFDRAPKRGDYAEWTRLFKKEFPDPRVYHMTFAWDSPDIGDTSEFIEHGFTFEDKAVLATSHVTPPSKMNSKLQVRPLRADEFKEMVEVQIRSAHDSLSPEEWRKFYVSQSARYQAMTNDGRGHWYGGFVDGRLVAGLGIYHHDRLGRFQIVCTDPAYQRQGICGTLVYESARHALSEGQIDQLVMCADPDYHAIRIYESVGFKRQLTEYGVSWWDKTRGVK